MLHFAEEILKCFKNTPLEGEGQDTLLESREPPRNIFFPCGQSRLSGFCWQWEEDEGRFHSACGSQFMLRFVMGRKTHRSIPPSKNQEFWEGGRELSPNPQPMCRTGGKAQTWPNIELLKAPAEFFFSPGI